MDKGEFGLGDRTNHSGLVLALVGLVTLLAVFVALGFARLLSWWVLLPLIGGSSELLASRADHPPSAWSPESGSSASRNSGERVQLSVL